MTLNLGSGLKRKGEEEKERREAEELHSLNESVVEFEVSEGEGEEFVEVERMSVSRKKRSGRSLTRPQKSDACGS